MIMPRKDVQQRVDLLERIVPFRFLTHDQKKQLAPHMKSAEYHAEDVVIMQGAPKNDVFLLDTGSVVLFDMSGQRKRKMNVIYAGHYFGERNALFNEENTLQVQAIESVRCYVITGKRFLQLLQQSRAFAQSLANLLRDSQGLFDAFDRFNVEMSRGVDRGTISIRALVQLYLDLKPALHQRARDPNNIDCSALLYATRRLPNNITRTFAFLLTDEMPSKFENPGELFTAVHTSARRRDVWELLPGKNMVLVRRGMSDLTDLVTCLCLYVIEARKIRARIEDYVHLKQLKEFLHRPLQLRPNLISFLNSLPFTSEEVIRLIEIWPNDIVQRLYEIACQRGMFSVDVRRHRYNYNSRRSDIWTAQVANATDRLMGVLPSTLPSNIKVHIISSNTHSVTNCLNPWYRENADHILQWIKRTDHPHGHEKWYNSADCVYATTRDYLAAYLDGKAEIASSESQNGILVMKETVSTGIQVQLVDLSQLRDVAVDKSLSTIGSDASGLIVNIDYAFGEQAEQIMRNLLMLFSNNLASVNFIGKAGALIGKRGDVLSPTAFVEQTNDLLQPIPKRSTASVEKLHDLLDTQSMYSGPMLTVNGTLLQNSMMLNFYRHIWGCIGIEMEGSYYYRPVIESKDLGVIDEGVKLRFFYYVSDVPLEQPSNLAIRMSATEGVPTVYAITRRILNGIIED